MPAPPPLSVLFPVRNGEETVREALDSILCQSFPSFEILAVDDGSTDGTGEILREVAGKDNRVRVLSQEPSGIVPALEAARAQARGAVLARMDADDISLPGRFQQQMELMASDRRVVACGTGVSYFPGESVRDGALRYQRWVNSLTSHAAIERDLFVECPLPHPTFFLRTSAIVAVGGYRDRGWPEDYDLLFRLWEAGGRFEKVPEIHLHWRESPRRLSRSHPAYSEESFRRCKVFWLIRTHLRRGREVMVWGAGPVGKAFARELKRQGGGLLGFVDLDPRKIGQEVHGVPVYSPPAVDSVPGAFHVSAVAKGNGREEIRNALTQAGAVEIQDFVAVA